VESAWSNILTEHPDSKSPRTANSSVGTSPKYVYYQKFNSSGLLVTDVSTTHSAFIVRIIQSRKAVKIMKLHPFETSGTVYRSTRRNTAEVLIFHRLRNEKFKSRSFIILGLESNASNFLCHAVYDLDMSTFHTSPLQLF